MITGRTEMHPDLGKLLDLQEKDFVLLDVDLRVKALLDELATLDAEVAALGAEQADARRLLQAGIKRREEIEAKVEGLRVLQERRRQRLDLAKTTRELQALGSELELARSVLAREESEWFRASEAVNSLEARVEAASARLAELQGGQGGQRGDLASSLAVLEEERRAAELARQASGAVLDRPLLMRYDRLRSVRTTSVVVPLRGDACGACFTAVPMSRRGQIRTGLLLDGCEACGVILYAAIEEA
jgi:hypothetical protein